MSTPIRGTEAVKAMRDLFSDYLVECERIERFKVREIGDNAGFSITEDEMLEVFERRRDTIAAKLENKGFKVTAESNDTLPSIARAASQLNEKE